MTIAPTAVFVEGDSDKRFVDRLLDHMGIVEVETDIIGGGASYLPTAQPRIQRRHDAGQRVGVIVDADTEVENRYTPIAACSGSSHGRRNGRTSTVRTGTWKRRFWRPSSSSSRNL